MKLKEMENRSATTVLRIPYYSANTPPNKTKGGAGIYPQDLSLSLPLFFLGASLMASRKRELPEVEESEAKKVKLAIPEDSSESKSKLQRVVLNPADCDLDFDIEDNGLRGCSLHEQGFAYCWSGARANVGITGGKYCFSCKIIDAQPVDMEDTPPNQQNVCRVGFSRGDDTVGSLGETAHSYGFGGTGKFSNAGQFLNYGDKFGVGDTVVCAVNLDSRPLATVGFSKNGKWLGTAKSFNAGSSGLRVVDSPVRKIQWESALFPHVLLKNVVVELQFSTEDGLVPQEGYKPWASAFEDGNAITGPTSCDTSNCEVMMMVGLPASGKTTWAEKWIKNHPEKRYVLLGTNLALDQMKVPGLLRKQNYGERFERLMERATGIFNTLLSRAARTGRNYIIDQTNVYKNARRRKMRPFTNFRKIAVVVFPKPEDLKLRADKRFREMGKEVPAEAVNEMLANYVLPMSKDMPRSDEYFDQVMFPELSRQDAQKYLDEMKCDLRSAPDPNLKCDRSPYNSDSLHSHAAPTVAGRPWQSSQSPRPQQNYDYLRHDQVNSAYHQGPGLLQRTASFPETYQRSQIPPLRRDPPYGPTLSYGSPLPRNISGNFQGSPPYDGIAISRSGLDPYQYVTPPTSTAMGSAYSPGSGHISEPYGREPFEMPKGYETPVRGSLFREGYEFPARRTLFTQGPFGRHVRDPSVPSGGLASRNPVFPLDHHPQIRDGLPRPYQNDSMNTVSNTPPPRGYAPHPRYY